MKKTITVNGEAIEFGLARDYGHYLTSSVPMEIRDALPDQCRRCPVLHTAISYALLHAERENWSQRRVNRAQKSVKHPDLRAPGAVAMRRNELNSALNSLDEESEAKRRQERVLEMLLSADPDECPGTLIGNLTIESPVERAVSKVLPTGWGFGPRERSCPNPGFEEISEEELVIEVLRGGNWVGQVDHEDETQV